ncbi:myc target protein 1 [Cynocephalus volans]|uniref:myc target protein 1 n=1 Tax=Cynocephalus volans TaxID=110931 RepID=UPI002FC630D8
MANNTTSLGSPWPENFWEDLIMSFTVSIAIGLVIGGSFWALFVCLSRRRRASAPISQWSSSRRARSSYPHGLNRTGFYRHSGCERRSNLSLASLTFQRQASLDQMNSFPRKSSFRASTFHPFLQCPPLPVETDSQLVTLPSARPCPTTSTSHTLSHPDFHWSSHSLRGSVSTPPPPAYESIIKAFPDS